MQKRECKKQDLIYKDKIRFKKINFYSDIKHEIITCKRILKLEQSFINTEIMKNIKNTNDIKNYINNELYKKFKPLGLINIVKKSYITFEIIRFVGLSLLKPTIFWNINFKYIMNCLLIYDL